MESFDLSRPNPAEDQRHGAGTREVIGRAMLDIPRERQLTDSAEGLREVACPREQLKEDLEAQGPARGKRRQHTTSVIQLPQAMAWTRVAGGNLYSCSVIRPPFS